MAIIVGKHTRAVIEPTFTPYEGLCRTHTVVINSNGSVNISTLDLGYMNENGVTVINIDTSNLIWNSLVDANAELFDVYQPILTFEHEDGSRLSLDCLIEDDEENGNVFIVSNEITAKPGQYKINFVLRERTTEEEDYPGNVGKEDDVNYSEVFASATFFGVVNILPYSTIESSFQEEDVTNLIYQDPVALQKPTIVLE